jgi:hypothetical protein
MATLRIPDLEQPVLSDDQRAAVLAATASAAALTPQSVVNAAVAATGLDHFGEPGFLERLGVWLKAGRQDVGLNDFGRQVLHGYCARYAANRLRLEDLLRRHPEVLDEPIDRPVFIAGLPRSGTTRLVNLMALDPRWRSLPYWEAVEPFSAAPAGHGGPADSRRARCQQAWQQLERLLPLLSAMHEMSPDHIHEDLELQALDFTTYNIEWTAHVPLWRDWYLSHDRTPHYTYLRTALQALQWQDRQAGRPRRRWLLKCPQHLENLPCVMEAFPDATVILTHRDPVQVIQSAVTMVAYGDRLRRHRIDLRQTCDYWTDRIARMLGTCVNQRDAVPAERSMDVAFAHFVADEAGTINALYKVAGASLDFVVRQALDLAVAAQAQDPVRVEYDLYERVGIDQAALRRRFDFYFDRFPSVRAA